MSTALDAVKIDIIPKVEEKAPLKVTTRVSITRSKDENLLSKKKILKNPHSIYEIIEMDRYTVSSSAGGWSRKIESRVKDIVVEANKLANVWSRLRIEAAEAGHRPAMSQSLDWFAAALHFIWTDFFTKCCPTISKEWDKVPFPFTCLIVMLCGPLGALITVLFVVSFPLILPFCLIYDRVANNTAAFVEARLARSPGELQETQAIDERITSRLQSLVSEIQRDGALMPEGMVSGEGIEVRFVRDVVTYMVTRYYDDEEGEREVPQKDIRFSVEIGRAAN